MMAVEVIFLDMLYTKDRPDHHQVLVQIHAIVVLTQGSGGVCFVWHAYGLGFRFIVDQHYLKLVGATVIATSSSYPKLLRAGNLGATYIVR